MNYEITDKISKVISELLGSMSFTVSVTYEESIVRGLVFSIKTNQSNLLIGRNGEILNNFEFLIKQIIYKKFPTFHDKFSIDCNDYKRKVEWELREYIKAAAEKCIKENQKVKLRAMRRFERLFIHKYLQEYYPKISSESHGREPDRHVYLLPIPRKIDII